MSQLHNRLQKRKIGDAGDTVRVTKMAAAATARPVTRGRDRLSKHHLQAYMQPEKSMRQYLAQQQISKPKSCVLPDATPTTNEIAAFTMASKNSLDQSKIEGHINSISGVLRSCEPSDVPYYEGILYDLYEELAEVQQGERFREASITNEWHQEWQVTSNDFVPSRPLSILMEPTNINLNSHARKAKRAYLGHFDVDNEPEGRITQRLRREEQEMKRLEQDLKEAFEEDSTMEKEREIERSEVRRAAREAEVIDLTDDDELEAEAQWKHMGVEDLENLPPSHVVEAWGAPGTCISQHKPTVEAIFWNPSAYLSSHILSAPPTTLDEWYSHRTFASAPCNSPSQNHFTGQTLDGFHGYHFA